MDDVLRTAEALYSAGCWLLGHDRHREALALFHTMLLVDSRDERGWLALATCHEQLEEPGKALMLCELGARACEGQSIRCTIALARLHTTLGDHDRASEAYAEAARLAEAFDEQDLANMIAKEISAR